MAREVGSYRVASGGAIDRNRPMPFLFNGRELSGYAGDTLASALLANGVRTVSRSFKFHRPRGVFSCGVEEAGAILRVGEGDAAVPSARAPLVPLATGLRATSQGGWPHVDFDVGRVLDWLSPLWAAGFYNKTFLWPGWYRYEPVIRRLAGLGRVPPGRDRDRYETSNLHCDVLVVGGGIAGLNAALKAANAGARVVIAGLGEVFGGEALWSGAKVENAPADEWIRETLSTLNGLPDVRLMPRTTVTGYYDHNVLALVERRDPEVADGARERFWTVRAQRVVLATGVIEQPLIFGCNDRPGIMLAGAARQYLRRYGVAVGRRVLVATNNDSAYALAVELKSAGVTVCGISDTRREVSTSMLDAMRTLGIETHTASIPVHTRGAGGLRQVTLGTLSDDGASVTSTRSVECDALAVSGGFSPVLHLYAQAGGKLAFDESSASLQPVVAHPSIEIAGSAASATPVGPRVSPVGDPARKWVDLLHDVTVADLELAVRENLTSVEHVKRYTTSGMAVDQGKTSSALTLELLGKLRRISARALGHTTYRPPFVPVTLGAIAGRELGTRFSPYRRLPAHDWHIAHGALMHDFGGWQRPVAYLRANESREQATGRECQGTRANAGLFDGSPLGKIEIHGPDALDFLDRFYINDLTTLRQGCIRYALMLRESGTLFDDGTVAMLEPDRYLITTTSGNAARVIQWLEEWRQCEWREMRVAIMPVSEEWATLTLAGPRARAVLSMLETDIDLSNSSFPHLSMREGLMLGTPVRVCRVSFTGELSYEIHVPSLAAPMLWNALIAAGAEEGLQPIGLDAVLAMRLEKGYLHIGTDTDGTTVPDDVGWGRAADRKSRDYIGKRSLRLPENRRADRLQLVGLLAGTGGSLITGAHLRAPGSREPTDGWITSSGTTGAAGEPIALALLRGGRARIGTDVDLYDAGIRTGSARVVSPPFYDATGSRMTA